VQSRRRPPRSRPPSPSTVPAAPAPSAPPRARRGPGGAHRPSRAGRRRIRLTAITGLVGLLAALAAALGVAFAATGGPGPGDPRGHHGDGGRSAAGASGIAGTTGAPGARGSSTAGGSAGGRDDSGGGEPNAACTLLVPARPTTAAGLATPYRLTATDPDQGPCHEADPAQSAFVQATVLDPATGTLAVYDPLVVDDGSRPAVAPVPPRLPAGAVVGVWFGFNGDTLTLSGRGAGECVNGLGDSLFGQFAYCGAPAFFRAAQKAESAGTLKVPPLGTAADGRPCPSTRDFSLVDQDQSDNVTTAYLADDRGRTAQDTARAAAALSEDDRGHGGDGTTTLLNASDNALLDDYVAPALGCTPWRAPDLADPGRTTTSLALDELQAAAHQGPPVALVPLNDPMTLVDGDLSPRKTGLYRAGSGQPALGQAGDDGSPERYCARLAGPGAARVRADRRFTEQAPSPTQGQDLYSFLTDRLAQSLVELGCPQAPTQASPQASTQASAPTPPAVGGAPGAAASGMPPGDGAALPTGSASATPGGGRDGRDHWPPRRSADPTAAASADATPSGDPSGSATAAGAPGAADPRGVPNASGGPPR